MSGIETFYDDLCESYVPAGPTSNASYSSSSLQLSSVGSTSCKMIDKSKGSQYSSEECFPSERDFAEAFPSFAYGLDKFGHPVFHCQMVFRP